jgi:cytochrome c oxidase subunit 1
MQYAHAQPVLHWNKFMSVSAFLLAVAQVPFIVNFFWSIRKGKAVDANPWQATTLEWAAAPSPPVAHGNFHHIPVVHRGPYEYSPPSDPTGYLPQHAAPQER